MKVSDMIQSKFLKKEDFDVPRVLTIKACHLEEVDKSGEQKWILYFSEVTKGMVLNVTKIRQLEAGFGGDSDDWVGKKIKVRHDPGVMMGPKVVGGIAISLPAGSVKVAGINAPQPKGQPQRLAPTPEYEDLQSEMESSNFDE